MHHWNKTPNIHNLKKKRFTFGLPFLRFQPQSAGTKAGTHDRTAWLRKAALLMTARKQSTVSETRYSSQDHTPMTYPDTPEVYFTNLLGVSQANQVNSQH